MNVVLDTNVVVSALLNAFGPSAQIMALVLSGELTLCCDSRIINEYEDVLSRPKFKFSPETVKDFLNFVEEDSLKVITKPLSIKLIDKSDEMFLETAMVAGAGYLITGNLKHFPKESFKGIRIVAPVKFISLYRG